MLYEVITYKVINWIGDIADRAQQVGARLQLLRLCLPTFLELVRALLKISSNTAMNTAALNLVAILWKCLVSLKRYSSNRQVSCAFTMVPILWIQLV